MSMPTLEELRRRFPKVDDPEIQVRRQQIVDALVEASPQIGLRFIEQGERKEARAALRRVLVRRQLTPSKEEDARIEACADLATLQRWLDRAVAAVSISDVLE